MECYFDNAATTRPSKEVADYLYTTMLDQYANPSSLHKKAFEAKKLVEYAEKQVQRVLGLSGRRIVFTSGATESTNLAIKGTLEKFEDPKKLHIITTTIEHPCVSEVFRYYENKGVMSEYISVDRFGKIDQESLLGKIRPNTKLISLIWVNNEFGAVQPISEIIKKIRLINPSAFIHIDAVQGYGKIHDDFSDVDMISISAHKFHGPKGIGALILKKNLSIVPQILGGGQQDNYRSGTINAPLIGAMGKACELLSDEPCFAKLQQLQRYLYDTVCCEFGEEVINTKIKDSEYAPHILNVSFEGLKGEVLLHMMEEDDIFLSTSSACSSHKKNKKSVLKEIGLSQKQIDGTIRISLSEYNTAEQIDFMIQRLSVAVSKLSRLKKGSI